MEDKPRTDLGQAEDKKDLQRAAIEGNCNFTTDLMLCHFLCTIGYNAILCEANESTLQHYISPIQSVRHCGTDK